MACMRSCWAEVSTHLATKRSVYLQIRRIRFPRCVRYLSCAYLLFSIAIHLRTCPFITKCELRRDLYALGWKPCGLG